MTPQRALVTGAGGFVGRWLCRELLERGWEVTATTLGGETDAAPIAGIRWRTEDLTDGAGGYLWGYVDPWELLGSNQGWGNGRVPMLPKPPPLIAWRNGQLIRCA